MNKCIVEKIECQFLTDNQLNKNLNGIHKTSTTALTLLLAVVTIVNCRLADTVQCPTVIWKFTEICHNSGNRRLNRPTVNG